jgi:hypothetical protein
MSGRYARRFLGQLSFTVALLALALPALAAKGAKPEFGPNVLIFDPSMPPQAIQKQIDAIYALQEQNEFSSQRSALLFLPGSYSVNVPVGLGVFEPAQHAVIGDVAEEQVVSVGDPDRAFGPACACIEALNGGIDDYVFGEARIDDLDGSIGIGRGGLRVLFGARPGL